MMVSMDLGSVTKPRRLTEKHRRQSYRDYGQSWCDVGGSKYFPWHLTWSTTSSVPVRITSLHWEPANPCALPARKWPLKLPASGKDTSRSWLTPTCGKSGRFSTAMSRNTGNKSIARALFYEFPDRAQHACAYQCCILQRPD